MVSVFVGDHFWDSVWVAHAMVFVRLDDVITSGWTIWVTDASRPECDCQHFYSALLIPLKFSVG